MINNNDKRPVGIFDSGVGGLTVAKEIRQLLPNESIIYVGDTARVPYGSKDPETLFNYGKEIIDFMLTHNVKAVVFACGTSSANTFDRLQEQFPDLPLVDVLRPGVAECVKLAEQNPSIRLGIIATAATINSGLFAKLLEQESPGTILHSRPCPLFASMVEAGLANDKNNPLLHFVAETYLADLRGQIDALVLGCTHYPLLTDILANILGNIQFINLAAATAHKTKNCLASRNGLNENNHAPEKNFFVSGSKEVFKKTAQAIFNENCEPQKIQW